MLADLKAETAGAVDDVRRLVYDLRPPALDELGLLGRGPPTGRAAGGCATAAWTSGWTPPGTLPRAGRGDEVAAYRIAIEAVANAARHAHARHVPRAGRPPTGCCASR